MNSNNKKVKILDQFKKNKKPVESKSKVSEPQINSKLPVEILERIFKIAAVNRSFTNMRLVCSKWNKLINEFQTVNEKKIDNGLFKWILSKKIIYKWESGNLFYNKLNLCFEKEKRSRQFASFEQYKDKYYLYGGLRRIVYSTLVHNRTFTDICVLNDLQVYSFDENKNHYNHEPVCRHINYSPYLAGHGASFLNNKMILFGGIDFFYNCSNSVYCLDLEDYKWTRGITSGDKNPNYRYEKRVIYGKKPEARHSHIQISLENDKILIIGGKKEENGKLKTFSDAWLLIYPHNLGKNAYWQEISVNNIINSPTFIEYSLFTRVSKNRIIVFGTPREHTQPIILNSLDLLSILLNEKKDELFTFKSQSQSKVMLCNQFYTFNAQNHFGIYFRGLIKYSHYYIEYIEQTVPISEKCSNCLFHSTKLSTFILDINKLTKEGPDRINLQKGLDEEMSVSWQTANCDLQTAPSKYDSFFLTHIENEMYLSNLIVCDLDRSDTYFRSYYGGNTISRNCYKLKLEN